ncbi:MAG TPA: ABC transporter ATP-binding protein [Caldilineaceae bacterium]|nr:ABC transporter ATP-binding protein [Caldilineaceae bacterium]
MSVPFLELRNVSKVFGGGLFHRKRTVALDNLSLIIDTGKPTVKAVAGESGSGKTTLGMILMGFLTPTSGQVLYKGKDMRSLDRSEQRTFRREVQAVFQDPFSVYNPFYPVDHVLEVPIEKFRLARSRQEARRLMESALADVGLQPEETLGRYPHQLSGGQRQRIMVARALLMKPRLIIADEPVSMVDASLRATILESLRKLNRDFGISILYITHDLTTAYHVSNDILVLYRGSIAEVGDVDHVIKQPQHPYTQLLVDSIPWPDLEHTWGQNRVLGARRMGDAGAGAVNGAGGNGAAPAIQNGALDACKFVDRCPHAMPICGQKAPPLYRVDPTRASACYLHQEAPVLPSEEINRLFG